MDPAPTASGDHETAARSSSSAKTKRPSSSAIAHRCTGAQSRPTALESITISTPRRLISETRDRHRLNRSISRHIRQHWPHIRLPLRAMGTTFHGPNPWPHITQAIRTRGPRHAAIAYLDHNAPEQLPLRAGDVLVVNASKAAVRAHATSPAALAHYLGTGVRVLSCPTLHAKVIATNRRAVIGSANATVSSTYSDDAVIITDDPDIITSVRKFIDGLDDLTEVDQPFIDNATSEWAIGRAVPIPGITGRIHNPDNDFLPTPAARMFIKHVVDYEPNPTEQHLIHEQQQPSRTTAGPVAKYQLQSLRLGKPSTITPGDVIVLVSADQKWIYPPALVTAEPHRIPRSGGAVMVFLRIRADLPPLSLNVAEKHLADLGHPGPRLRTDHYVRSMSIRTALLGLWNL